MREPRSAPRPVPVFAREESVTGEDLDSMGRLTKKQRPARMSAGRGRAAFDKTQWQKSAGGAASPLLDFTLASMAAGAKWRATLAAGRGRGRGAAVAEEGAAVGEKTSTRRAASRRRTAPATAAVGAPRPLSALDKRMQAQNAVAEDFEEATDFASRYRLETTIIVDRAYLAEYHRAVAMRKDRMQRAEKLRARYAQLKAKARKRDAKELEAARVQLLQVSTRRTWTGTRVRPNSEIVTSSFLGNAVLGNPGWWVDERVAMVQKLAALEQTFEANGVFGKDMDRKIDQLLEEDM